MEMLIKCMTSLQSFETTVSTKNTKLPIQSMQSNIGYMNSRFKVIIIDVYTRQKVFHECKL